jgi:hypothetical protein
VYCYDKTEANISEVRIDKAFNKLYPSYALFHVLSDHYLNICGFNYISDGYKTVLHASDIQLFLIRKFGFAKVLLHLHVVFRKPYGLIKLFYPFLKVIPFIPHSLRAVLYLIQSGKKKAAK